MPFMYLTSDFRGMSLEDQQKIKVRDGAIDPALLFNYVYGFRANMLHTAMARAALEVVLPTLTRCQHDLLTVEFGERETTLDAASLSTDALFDDPLDANVKKLEQAVEKVKAYMSF